VKRILIITAAVIAMAGLTAGCKGKDDTKTFSAPGGKVTVTTKEDGTVKEWSLKGEKGSATLSMGQEVSEENLGVPVYPGATSEEGGVLSMEGQGAGSEGRFSAAMLHTKDPVSSVVAFYKKKLSDRAPKFFEMNTPNGAMASFAVGEDSDHSTTIVVMEDTSEGGTRIQISSQHN